MFLFQPIILVLLKDSTKYVLWQCCIEGILLYLKRVSKDANLEKKHTFSSFLTFLFDFYEHVVHTHCSSNIKYVWNHSHRKGNGPQAVT